MLQLFFYFENDKRNHINMYITIFIVYMYR